MVRGFALFLGAAFLIQLVRPARTNPPTYPERTLSRTSHVTREAKAVLERACRDCHSNDTEWPWYTNVAPVSWFVIDHVNSGRRHFTYSEWAKYDEDQKPRILKDICDLTRKGDMPVSTYLWMHADAKVSGADTTALCTWTDAERLELQRH